MSDVLPTILATFTGPRYQVVLGRDFEWSENSWTNNIFRAYEVLFGRRIGIKAEASAIYDGELWYHYAHSWEASFSLIEKFIRGVFEIRFPYRIYIPILMTPQGIPVPTSPYLFAIAFDTSANITSSSNISTSYTVTGSNPFIICTGDASQVGTPWPTNCSYNGVNLTRDYNSMTLFQPNQWDAFYYLAGPATGSNTFALNWTGTASANMVALGSYSGVSQAGTLDSSANGFSASATTINATTTVVAANSWLISEISNNGGNVTIGGGSSVTRQHAFAQYYGDSNGAVGTGSQTITWTFSGATQWNWYVASIAPFAAVGPTNVKTWDGITQSTGIKIYEGVALASVKSVEGVT